MGLLDDAIREHLELKRLRGADPGEVAREQREALDPVPREDRAEGVEDAPLPADAPNHAADHAVSESTEPVAAPPVEYETADAPDHEPAPDADPENAGETAELDMRSVLGEEQEARADVASVEEYSLEWEVPADAARGEESEQAEPAEDVLEETPDFLRDTPEQERLWFEQRPPRDFDFDK